MQYIVSAPILPHMTTNISQNSNIFLSLSSKITSLNSHQKNNTKPSYSSFTPLHTKNKNNITRKQHDANAVTFSRYDALAAEPEPEPVPYGNSPLPLATERLQDEFRKLSMQMATTFEANETATTRALTEAGELRMQKKNYWRKCCVKSNKRKKHEELVGNDFSEAIQLLKDENEKLTVEISCLSEQVKQKEVSSSDLELMKKSLEEYETLFNTQKEERNELVSTIALLKKEAEQSLYELNRTGHLKDEEEKAGKLLHSELDALKTQYSDLQRSLFDDETEKEILRKQIFHLNGELKKKNENSITHTGRPSRRIGPTTSSREDRPSTTTTPSNSNKPLQSSPSQPTCIRLTINRHEI
ncbi:unnamed protein product [Vicia faba]|uniref:Uncharacterized protein n=1 Tax=Vicia faba TaxID=3906 RepID=A0AAV1A355_VICFA|nr:unnamed protein product [Vicia faba]